jgi:hypothetical protein
MHKKRWRGLIGPRATRRSALGLPIALVSRLPQRVQRTRRFFHDHRPYPVVYRISSRKPPLTRDFPLLSATLNWTLSTKALLPGPLWLQGRDLNPRPPGYEFVSVVFSSFLNLCG